MYKVITTGKAGSRTLVKLADEYGGKAEIVRDDHCLVLLVGSGSKLKPATHWFREAVEAIPKEW